MNKLTKYISEPKFVIDIGANIGEFSKSICNLYPNCDFVLFEANPNCEKYLKELPFKYFISGLSDKKGTHKFHIENINPIATGASIYKENSIYYETNKYNTIEINSDTLDSFKLYENDVDLIKIDTQGSELDIINGGITTLQNSKYLLIEVSLTNYNINAPLFDVINEKLTNIGYRIVDIIDYHKFTNGDIFQMDVLYHNVNYENS